MDYLFYTYIVIMLTIAERYAGNISDEDWYPYYDKWKPVIDGIEEQAKNTSLKDLMEEIKNGRFIHM